MSYVTIAEAMEPGDVLFTDSGKVERTEVGWTCEAYGHRMEGCSAIIATRFLNPYGNDEYGGQS